VLFGLAHRCLTGETARSLTKPQFGQATRWWYSVAP
jgi:hypothetical protein